MNTQINILIIAGFICSIASAYIYAYLSHILYKNQVKISDIQQKIIENQQKIIKSRIEALLDKNQEIVDLIEVLSKEVGDS